MMGKEDRRNCSNNEKKVANFSVPPGFISLTSFMLKRIEKGEENNNSTACLSASKEPVQMDTESDMSDVAAFKRSLRCRPWIVFNQSNHDSEESDNEQLDMDIPLNAFRSKGVTRGCPDCSDCLKVTARWHPEEARNDFLEDAPVFYPTEEEFKDTLKYVASIRSRAEPYGICRIVPPSSWLPPFCLKEKCLWESSKFISHTQRIDGLHIHYPQEKRDKYGENTITKKRRGLKVGLDCELGKGCGRNQYDVEGFESEPGPEFTLKTFKRFADDFKDQYFQGLFRIQLKKLRFFVEVILRLEFLAADFQWYPDTLETSECPEYLKWNLNNLSRLPGSLLSFESSSTSHVVEPQLRIGMCFSSLNWKVEEHHLYSLHYMHLGEPAIWHSVPGRFAVKFETARKKYLPYLLAEQLDMSDNLVRQLSPSVLKSEVIPVYRCSQYPGEFVLVFPELYAEQRRQTTISYDKILLGAAREAVRAQWEIALCRKNTPDNLRWKEACGRDGILAKALNSRIKSEFLRREYLCTSMQTQRIEKDFDDTCKRECSICLCDLHFSAVRCQCSIRKYSCLNHAKQLCSCKWSDKILLFLYKMSELNVLLEALEGKLSAIYKWAKEDLGLVLHSTVSKRCLQPPGNLSGSHAGRIEIPRNGNTDCVRKQNAELSQVAVMPSATGSSSAARIKAELKARLHQSTTSNDLKANDLKAKQETVASQFASTCQGIGSNSASGTKTNTRVDVLQSTIMKKVEHNSRASPIISSATSDSNTFLHKGVTYDVSSESTSNTSSSDSDDTPTLGFSNVKGGRVRKEILMSELLKDTSSKHNKVDSSSFLSRTQSTKVPSSCSQSDLADVSDNEGA
ncbi:Lysine-specific demethylase [Quillaja saponaria]|uniref:Lysine-specific demethylase n=1 Tax=Quillaja saponaria TaxID=32244 RepID=A0AAD7VIX3_QUISA|nr:Lysine-specific demethylase [Quillaja saponaria]